jgi:hypothetical protein
LSSRLHVRSASGRRDRHLAGRQSHLATQHDPPRQPEHLGQRNTARAAGEGSAPVGGTSRHRSPRGLGRHAKPGSILYTPRVNKRSPAQNLASLSPLRWRNQSRDPELPAVVHAAWRRDLRADFTVVRWTLHRQETALAAAHHIEGYAHASCKDFGVMAGSLLGHDLAAPINNAAARLP